MTENDDSPGKTAGVARPRPADARKISWVIFWVVMLVVGVYYVGIKGSRRSAFARWRPQLQRLATGENIWRTAAFPTPPIMALVLLPFALLPVPWGMAAWFIFKAELLALALRWLLAMTGLNEPARAWWGLLALLLAIRPPIADLMHGNVNLVVLFLLVACLHAARLHRDKTAGMWLGLAIATKLTPLLLLPYFAYKRLWVLVGATLVSLVVWLLVVPGLVFGPRQNSAFLTAWVENMVLPYVMRGEVETEQINQSLPGLVHRLMTPALAIKPDDGRPPLQANLLELSSAQARLFCQGLSLLIVALLAWSCRQPWPQDRAHPALLHEFCLVLLAMLLLSERTWKSHYVTLVVVMPVLVATLVAGRTARTEPVAVIPAQLPNPLRTRFPSHATKPAWVITASLLLAQLLMASTGKDLLSPLCGEDASKWAEAYGAYTWAAVLLAATHVYCLRTLAARKEEGVVG